MIFPHEIPINQQSTNFGILHDFARGTTSASTCSWIRALDHHVPGLWWSYGDGPAGLKSSWKKNPDVKGAEANNLIRGQKKGIDRGTQSCCVHGHAVQRKRRHTRIQHFDTFWMSITFIHLICSSFFPPNFLYHQWTHCPNRHQFQKAAELLGKHPETMVIIDHLGSPLMEDLQENADQRLGSAHPNLWKCPVGFLFFLGILKWIKIMGGSQVSRSLASGFGTRTAATYVLILLAVCFSWNFVGCGRSAPRCPWGIGAD